MKKAPTPDGKLAYIRSNMTEAARQVADEFLEKATQLAYVPMLIYYDMGVRLCYVISEEAEYGSNVVEQLAEYLGLRPKFLYDLRTFSHTYDRDFVERCARRRMSDGGHLCFQHLNMLTMVTLRSERMTILERVFVEALTLENLARIVGAAVSSRNPRVVHRRKLKSPVTPFEAAEQVEHGVARLNNHANNWAAALAEFMKTLDPATDTKFLHRHLCSARAELHALMSNFGPPLDQAIEQLEDVIDTRDQPQSGEEVNA